MFVSWLAVFIVGKFIFIAFYNQLFPAITFADILAVVWHGLKMDMAVAGYLTAIPGLLLTVGAWMRNSLVIRRILKWYIGIVTVIVVTTLSVDTVLYGYWDFKLDITPLFYVVTAPEAALASVSSMMLVASIVLMVALSFVVYKCMVKVTGISRYTVEEGKRPLTSGVMLLLTAVLFIPIRGGFGVSTVNLSSAYYSNNMRLNHAAVNPAFSLIYSATHQQSFNKMFRFMDDEERAAVMAEVTAPNPYTEGGLLKSTRPDIYIIILESFSDGLFPSLGGESVAVGLDSVATDGLVFTDFYSSTFRTDRALPAILNGFPAQATTSLLKYPEKTRHIASLAKSLAAEGYNTNYYYGGDASFANKRTYLLNTGYENVNTVDEMPQDAPMSKWGVSDGVLFDVAYEGTMGESSPKFTVIQTLSSHEPFEVPYESPRFKNDPACNAFAYTDSCVTSFINKLMASPEGENALVILVPDHYGCYPHNPAPDDVVTRHRIPLIMTGGALARHGRVDTPASQVDIAATLLDAMGIDRSGYPFSRNILDPSVMPVAFMSTPVYSAVVDSTGVASVYNIESKQFRNASSEPTTHADSINAAYIQTIYDTISSL